MGRISVIVPFLAALLCLGCVGRKSPSAPVACTEDRPVISSDSLPGEDTFLRIAFLGYYSDFASFRQSPAFDSLAVSFPELKAFGSFTVDAGGENVFLIMPSHEGAHMEVSLLGRDMFEAADSDSAKLFSGDGIPVLLRGPRRGSEKEMSVLFIDPHGHTVEFSPSIGADGTPVCPPEVSDVTELRCRQVIEDQDEKSGFTATLRAGRVMVSVDIPRMIRDGLLDRETARGHDTSFSVRNLNGYCRDILLDTDTDPDNPMLYMLMAGGWLRALALKDAVERDDTVAGAPVPVSGAVVSLSLGESGVTASTVNGSVPIAPTEKVTLTDGNGVTLRLDTDWSASLSASGAEYVGTYTSHNRTVSLLLRRSETDLAESADPMEGIVAKPDRNGVSVMRLTGEVPDILSAEGGVPLRRAELES